MKILFSGGGTLGPVTPLLGMYDVFTKRYRDVKFLWVGTKQGPEQELIKSLGIPFVSISAGKFRRYFSILNFFDIGRVVVGFVQSIKILWKFDPDVCISAGGFVSVPLHLAAWLMGIPTWVHQQDVKVGLANELMAPLAKTITTALDESQKLFSRKKTRWLGNPVRADVFLGKKDRAKKLFGIKSGLPVVFATGGGTGSMRVNQIVVQAVQHLQGICEIVHLTGRERPQDLIAPAARQFDHYHPYQFFTTEMKDAYALADIVVSRGGFGTITELAALGKVAILVPKPGHQVENVRFLQKAQAVLLLDENLSDGNHLAHAIKDLLQQPEEQQALRDRLTSVLPPATSEAILEALETVTDKK